MTIGPAGMAKIIGQLSIHPDEIGRFKEDLENYVAALTPDKMDEEEKRFLKDFYIIDIIHEYIRKLDIRYNEAGTNKGR